jgi:hypothetical protein
MAEVTYYVALPFVATDGALLLANRLNASIPSLSLCEPK